MRPMRSVWALVVVLVGIALVEGRAAADDSLRFLRLNEQGAETWYRARDGAVVIRVPGGEYLKRPYEGWEAEEDPEPVEVAAFFVDRCEVTNRQYALFLEEQEDVEGLVLDGVRGLVPPRGPAGEWRAEAGWERHPVTSATGRGALAYALWVGGRLPTADEWEKAAGGPGARMFPWGEEAPDRRLANFARPTPRGLLPVGSFVAGASPYGCLDMAGNAYERVMMTIPDGRVLPVMLKGGSWASPHPLNLRVLDMCVQPMEVAEGTVGFRCVMDDPEPTRPARRPATAPALTLATDLTVAVAEARRRRVPIFLSLQYDTCGQCDRTRAQLFLDPRFVAYCNEHLVVVVGHQPGDAFESPHAPGEEDRCPLYPGLTCQQHEVLFGQGLAVVGEFYTSPGNFVLHPDRIAKGAGEAAVLIAEDALPKWGNAVDAYLAAFEQARRLLTEAPAPR